MFMSLKTHRYEIIVSQVAWVRGGLEKVDSWNRPVQLIVKETVLSN